MGGAIASPSTAYVYDWNILPIGQVLWLKHLETFINFPPLQDPASYNLEQVMAAGPGDEDWSRLTRRKQPNACNGAIRERPSSSALALKTHAYE